MEKTDILRWINPYEEEGNILQQMNSLYWIKGNIPQPVNLDEL